MQNYIDLDLDDALQRKWRAGVSIYRKNTTDDFIGNVMEELFQECLDGINLSMEAERQGFLVYGVRASFRNLARTIQFEYQNRRPTQKSP